MLVEAGISIIFPTPPSVFVFGNILLNIDSGPATNCDQMLSILGILPVVERLIKTSLVQVWVRVVIVHCAVHVLGFDE